MSGFQRARQPEQISIRREALLTAARALFDTEGPQGTSLSAIAAHAGFTKSNVYRYFESREDVLLALLLDEFEQLTLAMEQAIAIREDGDAALMAEAMTGCFLAQPRFCQLSSIFASVLEQNVSEDAIVAVKRRIAALTNRILAALSAKMPNAHPGDLGWAFAMTISLIAGMWPAVHPSAPAAAVMSRPEFINMRLVPERDLQRSIGALLASIA